MLIFLDRVVKNILMDTQQEQNMKIEAIKQQQYQHQQQQQRHAKKQQRSSSNSLHAEAAAAVSWRQTGHIRGSDFKCGHIAASLSCRNRLIDRYLKPHKMKKKTETKSTEKTDEEHAASKILVITQTQHKEMHGTGATTAAAAAGTQRAKRKQRHNCALPGQSQLFCLS